MINKNIEEVLPHIYRLPVPLEGNPLRELNTYVIKGEKNLLVDTGFRTEVCRRALLEGLDALGIDLGKTDILLTHLHADHSGNAADILCEGNEVYMSAIDCRYIMSSQEEGGTSLLHRIRMERLKKNGIGSEMLKEMLAATPSRTMAADPAFTDYTALEDGDELRVGDYTLKAIYTPGHTPGHMCFEILGTGAMLLGDHVLFDITPNITDWAGIEDSLGDYLDSLHKLEACNVSIPLPGHRKPGNFKERIEELKAHHRKRLEECRQVIRSLDHARLYDITGHMTWKIRTDSWDTFPPAQRWFALGECLSHIDHLMRMGKITQHEEGGLYWYEA